MIKKRLLPTSLARRFNFLMVLFSVLGVLLVAILSYYEHIIEARSDARSIAVDRSLTILDAMETAASRESISRFIFSIAAQRSVESIALVDAGGRVMLASKRRWQNADVSVLDDVIDEQWLAKPAGEELSVYWDERKTQAVVVAPIEPVNPASSVIRSLQGGRLMFALDARSHIASATREALFDAFWASSILVVMMLLVSRALHRQVARPLNKLCEQAHNPDNTSVSNERVPVGQVRELKALAVAISELAEARAALGTEKQRLKDIADSIPGAVYEYRHHPVGDDEFLYFSDGIQQLVDLDAETIRSEDPARIGASVWSLIVPADHEKLEQATQAANYPWPSEWQAEYRVQVSDGIRWIWGHAMPVADDQPGQLFRGVMLDITDRKELEQRLQQAATHDPLTGALNRAGIEPHLESSLAGAQRRSQPMSIVLLDIDYFKNVNDSFGHALGDSVLVQLVNTLKRRLRKADSLARWGGEEFLVLLPDTDPKGAFQLADALRQAVEQATFEHRQSLTISLGTATANAGDSLKSLVRRADDNLYAAKHAGRNQVMGLIEKPESMES
ncbi:diguanylate cyclase (GGDEF)-like protein [Marinobacter persicus]|uniref:diguanylate cyclase n=1 Tax=Marinobacter persicus TaxID=930118 RepID=A0A2S6G8Y1_9GAMM|nr:diguanylate cyclase (GGDEF)-like protein [Marinobacter persicus]PPK55538.1 diguanylate cyclase (GGDEF)-like protein [Marinobacter persicus]PPK58472.1 diguanylate cyclase (GGDEF)-like protein [Marinobacter persicus]